MRLRLLTLVVGLITVSGCASKHDRAESFIEQGIQNTRKGELDEAGNDFDQAISLDPQNADAYYDRGIVKSKLEDWDGAVAAFTHAIQLNPQNATVYFYRGIAKQQKGDLAGALTDYTQTISFNPQLAQVYLNRGMVESQMSNWDGALADYNHNIKLDPKSAVGYFYRGILEERRGGLGVALVDYTQAIEIKPDCTNTLCAHVYDRRGILKLERGDLDGALADLDQAIEFASRDAGFHMDRGVANYLNHRPSAAIADFKKAAELQFVYYDYPQIFTWLVKAEQADQLAAANEELKDYFLARGGRTNDWPVQVGHFLTGESSQSDFLKAANSTDPETDKEQHCEAYFYIAIKNLLAGDKPAAMLFFQECIATDVKTFYEYRMAQIKLRAWDWKK